MTTSANYAKRRGLRRQLKPAWTGVNIALMILGFMIAWPIGLFMIAYMIWGRDWGLDLSNFSDVEHKAKHAKDRMKTAFDSGTSTRSTGNRAFDEWREAELSRLAKERQKLDDAKKEFDAYVEELRRARDREEFDKFYGSWNSKAAPDADDMIDITPGK